MAKRLQSPSSINTFKQCKRKYYYQYIEKLPTRPSIHLVRGNIVHSVLEDFYDIDVSKFREDNYDLQFKVALQRLLLYQWQQYSKELAKLDMNSDKLKFYFEESMVMVMNWGKIFLGDFSKKLQLNGSSIMDVFQEMTPVRELEYKSDEHQVRGFIDAIHHENDQIHIVDYKTNARSDIKSSIILQLSIYSLLYQEKHNKLPDKVGIFFLRDRLKMLPVKEEMIQNAKAEVEMIHAHTDLTEDKTDYGRTVTPLCKWKTGQCDFYETCQPHKNGKIKWRF
jgi:CRISPR/Cas system-associated exonuclease Cas4 (RecB family)